MGPLTRALATAISLLLVTAGAAHAQGSSQTYTVNSTADAIDGGPNGICSAGVIAAGPCTLRAAIQEANSTVNPDTIILPPGTYNLTLTGSESSSTNDLDITQPVTIDGGGARTTIVDQQTADRVVEITGTATPVVLEGITLTGGTTPSGVTSGAGLRNLGPSTSLVDSAVRGNANGVGGGPGGGIENAAGTLTIERSLITGNSTASSSGGGGIFINGGNVNIVSSTITANTASAGAAIRDFVTSGAHTVTYSTIANNTVGGGAAVQRQPAGTMTFRGTIVGPNAGNGTNCAGPIASAGHNIDTAATCGFNDATDKPNTDPLLDALAYSRPEDQTETLGPLVGSPAIDGGNSAGCPASDQRGLPRPGGATCDVGAVEVQPPPPPPPVPATLLFDPPSANRTPGDANTLTATVQLSNGAPAVGQSVRFAVAGPNDTAGAVITDGSGRAQISWDGVLEGTDLLTAYVDTNANLTPDPGEPTGQASVVWALPVPRQGRTANIEPISGRVRITLRRRGSGKVIPAGSRTTQVLTEARQVPLDTVVDTRRGRVLVSTIANSAGSVQKGEFYGGVFTTRQPRTGRRPVTEMRMTESLICQRAGRGKVTASRARSRKLWGRTRGRGRYRTRGRYSTATVRGTVWVQKDNCRSTTTVVREGIVDVRDLAKRRTVRVRAGRRYTARRATARRR